MQNRFEAWVNLKMNTLTIDEISSLRRTFNWILTGFSPCTLFHILTSNILKS